MRLSRAMFTLSFSILTATAGPVQGAPDKATPDVEALHGHHNGRGDGWGRAHWHGHRGGGGGGGGGGGDFGAGNPRCDYDPNAAFSRQLCGGNGDEVYDPASGVCFRNHCW